MVKKIVRQLVGDHERQIVIIPAPPEDARAYHHPLTIGPGIHVTAWTEFHIRRTAAIGAEPNLMFAAARAGNPKYDLTLLHCV
jgi:hypothetical protein